MKVGAIIQARMDSSRLPGKVLMQLPFMSGNTILEHIVKQLKKIHNIDQIIIATSNETTDAPITMEAKRLGVEVFQGSKDNVLDRFVKTAKAYGIDTIIRMTGDNPIVLTNVIEESINIHLKNKVDYTRSCNLPYGTNLEIVQNKTLNRINLALEQYDANREHVTLYINKKRGLFHVQELNLNKNTYENLSNIRLTIDYPSDFALMNILFCYLKMKNYNYSLQDISMFFYANPWAISINNQNTQKKQFNNFEEELEEARNILSKLELTRVLKKLNQIK